MVICVPSVAQMISATEKPFRNALSSRDQLIYAEFNGYNQADLAMKHKMSIQWLYKIVDRVRSADIASRQSSINFDDEDDDDQ